MIFILPIRTSIKPRQTPYMNYALIAVNVLIFLLSYSFPHSGSMNILRPWAEEFKLVSVRPELWQFISYAFLHGGYAHVIFNMFFLYLFGNNVNERLGHIGYLSFYLAGAVFSGLGHVLLSPSPVLGASGAVCAVTGAYLVLFPQTLITVFYWFFFIGSFEVSALYFIAFKLIFLDNILAAGGGFVAYDAHLTGYAFGILSMLGMLWAGLIESSGFDLMYMIRQWNRRRVFRDVVASGADPFSPVAGVKRIKVKEVKSPADIEREEKVAELRIAISQRITERNLPAACEMYLELMALDSDQVLPRQALLDIANQLASENKSAESARAYEQFLKHYGAYEYSDQVELMLGVLYSRYLNKPELAIKYLKSALKKLHDPGQLKMCKDELAGLES